MIILALATNFYDFFPPFERTNVSESGNWTYLGAANNLKYVMQLTQDLPNLWGIACNRIPTLFSDWKLEIEISAGESSNNVTGYSFFVFFTEDVCPRFPTKFKGMVAWINTTQRTENGESPIYLMTNNGNELSYSTAQAVGTVKLGKTGNHLILEFTKTANIITAQSSTHGKLNPKNPNFEVPNKYGYFTIAALTTREFHQSFELHSVRVTPLSEFDHPNRTEDFSSISKKIIHQNRDQRRKAKRERRARMKSMLQYKQDSDDHNDVLSGAQQAFKDALNLIGEAYDRGADGIDSNELESFINFKLKTAIEQAYHKIQLSQQELEILNDNIEHVWSDLKTDLLGLVLETQRSLGEMQRQIYKEAGNFKIKPGNFSHLTSEKITNDTPHYILPIVLIIICIAEAVVYFVFFCSEFKRTKGFKKFD